MSALSDIQLGVSLLLSVLALLFIYDGRPLGCHISVVRHLPYAELVDKLATRPRDTRILERERPINGHSRPVTETRENNREQLHNAHYLLFNHHCSYRGNQFVYCSAFLGVTGKKV